MSAQKDHKPEDILPSNFINHNNFELPPTKSVDNAKPQTLGCCASFIIIGLFLLFIFRVAGCDEDLKKGRPSKVSAKKQQLNIPASITGYDSATGSIIDPINIFIDYENRNRGLAGKAKHGETVTILEKSGRGVKIRTNSGITGWVSDWFVKEN